MRGKATFSSLKNSFQRITPACAGKRSWPTLRTNWEQDHPRVCGEKVVPLVWTTCDMGSPPRVRGKVRLALPHFFRVGITPACAGKSKFRKPSSAEAEDHPRVCGEKSPQNSFQCSHTRITPACAGKRKDWRGHTHKAEDHPRVCGEKNPCSSKDFVKLGSPPRVRGKVLNAPIISANARITPACAGKRLKRSHSIGHFSYILCLFHSVLHRASASGGSRAGPCAPPCLPAQNAVPV